MDGLRPCRAEVYKYGSPVLIIAQAPAAEIERWVQSVAARGHDVDWHFAGGRAIVLALGPIEPVMLTIRELIATLPEKATYECCQ